MLARALQAGRASGGVRRLAAAAAAAGAPAGTCALDAAPPWWPASGLRQLADLGGTACSARGGGGGDKKGPAVPGVAYLKDAPEPLVLPSYPAWLAPLATQPKVAADALAPRDGRVFFKKTNLARIKKDNFLRDKKR
jgi:hypothetical protein